VLPDSAACLDKRSRHWRVLRWLIVGCYVSKLVVLLAVDRLCVQMRTTLELPPAVIENFDSSPQWVVAQGHARVAALRVEMYWVIKALMTCGMGTALFVYAVSH
jgi:hypothetical protein